MTGELPERLAVVGGGRMGSAIAQVFAAAGTTVAVFDPSAATREAVHVRVAQACRLLGLDAAEVVGRVRTANGIAPACAGADLVIEAGPENLAVKREIFAELDALVPPEVTLATNTSAIPIGRIADGLAHPERVLGTHFWNPPYLIPLVELVGRGDLGASTGQGFRTWQPGQAERRLAEVNESMLRQGRLDGPKAEE